MHLADPSQNRQRLALFTLAMVIRIRRDSLKLENLKSYLTFMSNSTANALIYSFHTQIVIMDLLRGRFEK